MKGAGESLGGGSCYRPMGSIQMPTSASRTTPDMPSRPSEGRSTGLYTRRRGEGR